jgi:hypothetical protein
VSKKKMTTGRVRSLLAQGERMIDDVKKRYWKARSEKARGAMLNQISDLRTQVMLLNQVVNEELDPKDPMRGSLLLWNKSLNTELASNRVESQFGVLKRSIEAAKAR